MAMKTKCFIPSSALFAFVLSSCCNCEMPENEVGRYIPHKIGNQTMIIDTKTSKMYSILDDGKTYFIDIVNNKSSGKWVLNDKNEH